MSLEKEPAGAFNKAQRLIECPQYTYLSVFCKEGSRFVFSPTLLMPVGGSSRRAVGPRGGLYRLTWPRQGGDVGVTEPHRRDGQIRSSEAADDIRGCSHSPIPNETPAQQAACRIAAFRSPARSFNLQVLVRDNNVDQALRVLKKKMQREGVFREMKQRRAYEKPSERKAREKSEAIRRARKLARKQAIREGLLPAPPKKKLPERKPALPQVSRPAG
jgi:small subunit ribosomal protein S21